MLTNNWPGMWKEINSQPGVFLNIMNITGPSVYNGRIWFTLLHMAEAPHWTLNPLQEPSPPPGSDKRIYWRIWKIFRFGWRGGSWWLMGYLSPLMFSTVDAVSLEKRPQQQIADTTWWYDHTMVTLLVWFLWHLMNAQCVYMVTSLSFWINCLSLWLRGVTLPIHLKFQFYWMKTFPTLGWQINSQISLLTSFYSAHQEVFEEPISTNLPLCDVKNGTDVSYRSVTTFLSFVFSNIKDRNK